MINILVTGGAGYIGSHVTQQLVRSGYRVVVIDNLHRGHREAVDPQAQFYQLALSETAQIAEVMQRHEVDAVMHFAALAYVGESVTEPIRYYENNVAGSLSLLKAMQLSEVRKIIFSSTCATYGIPAQLPIDECTPQFPINPYGWSKFFVERILTDTHQADSEFASVCLRYFNVAGCAADGSIGEDHDPETHLIPVLLQVALGQRPHVTVFGTDYPTPDGTCIRDYIHVEDLANAHIFALKSLQSGDARVYNLGIGNGFSVNEVIAAARKVTGAEIPVIYGDRRPGDPPILFTRSERIRTELGWSPQYTDLTEIIGTAWNWFRRHPQGYAQ
ncbi:MAG: UDP-glucose 4-epimerase GalE [Planctomycetaceae bacterium]